MSNEEVLRKMEARQTETHKEEIRLGNSESNRIYGKRERDREYKYREVDREGNSK